MINARSFYSEKLQILILMHFLIPPETTVLNQHHKIVVMYLFAHRGLVNVIKGTIKILTPGS